jgi:hypothetical protein
MYGVNVCVLCFSLQGVCLGAKHLSMPGLAVVGVHCERTGQRERVVGVPSVCVRGSCCAGHGVSRWRGVRWMSCVAWIKESQGYKRELRAPGLADAGSVNFLAFTFLCCSMCDRITNSIYLLCLPSN